MKGPIQSLFVLIVILFAVLVGFTSYWSVFEAEALRDNPANRRDLLAEQRIKRGIIRSADGEVLAGNRRVGEERYRRRYPTGDLFAHPVGYSYTSIGRSGLERFYNDRLVGRSNELVSVLDSLLGDDGVGDDLETTLDASAQRAAMAGLRAAPGGRGSVVALDVETGAVKVMASAPSFDPNEVDRPEVFRRLNTDEGETPLVNRATQGLYPPGSTFKVVTATAALDTGEYEPTSVVSGANNKEISGVPLQNFGGADYGMITLTEALTRSVNTVWAEVAEEVGARTIARYMDRYGFGEKPPLDLPEDEVLASGARRNGRLIEPTSRFVDIGRLAIGQSLLLVTPLQMATVAQTIANAGVRQEPYLVSKAFDADGRTVFEQDPEEAVRVMSPETSRELTVMMRNVVSEGTGTAAALAGVEVAGKTGTAELTNEGLNTLWFIGFTGRHAVAVVVERVQGGSGGTVAAPIAKQVLEALDD